jgi:hypothetical protein
MDKVKDWIDRAVETASKLIAAAMCAAVSMAAGAVVGVGSCFVLDILAPIVGRLTLYAIAVAVVFCGLTAVLYEGR